MSVAILTGLDLVLQLIDRVSAAAVVVKKAHAEGRPLTAEELTGLRDSLDIHLVALDAEIKRAEAEGR